MITAEIQIHGYRKGHQLLASSIVLPKEDQTVVDRLSDVAGPLRPKEQFKPYLSAYPLPSGTHYVVARTWQDVTVPRAGCVLTKSVLIDALVWSVNAPLLAILQLLDSDVLPDEAQAVRMELPQWADQRLHPATNFNGSELLEALFLEDAKPVVVFDAPDPELVALRLLTSLWPDIRRRFSLSTFALSPRKIGGRDLDLVFAPSNAKAKFSDWPGRRVDGRLPQTDRHRWTSSIVSRVFEKDLPKLLSDRELSLLGDRGAQSAASLRIALLWEELSDKLHQTPTAALGLLDIANSGMVSNFAAVKALEPRLAEATRHAASTLSTKDAWDFVGAIARKMQGHNMPVGKHAIEALVEHLAETAPDGAISLLIQPDPKQAIESFVPNIAMGLGKALRPFTEHLLANAPMSVLASLVAQGGPLTDRVAADDVLIRKIGDIFEEVDQSLASRAGAMLLPSLVEDRQLPAALPFFIRLDAHVIATELRRLGEANGYKAIQMSTALIVRARDVGGLLQVRDVLVQSKASVRRDALLSRSMEPVAEDMLWLLNEKHLSKATSTALLVGVLKLADDQQFAALLGDSSVGERIVERLPDDAIETLTRAALQENLPLESYIRIVQSVIPKIEGVQRFQIAERAIGRLLRNRFKGDEAATLNMLLGILEARLDGRWAAKVGVGYGTTADVASRNLLVFESAPLAVRKRMIDALDEIAIAVQGRDFIDLTEAAYDACARLFFDAEKLHKPGLIEAAGRLIPSLLRARQQPVSLLIAALFPVIYRELSKDDDVPELLKFVPFFDWDRCKAVRRELVDAFLSSSWPPGNLALTAYRCGDVSRILKRIVKSYDGAKYLSRLENDLGRLGEDAQRVVRRNIAEISTDRSHGLER